MYFGILPRTSLTIPNGRTLQTWIFSNLSAFLAVAYLSSLLAQSLRRQGAELEVKRGELQDLQAFNEDIIHSMRGGLFTTDLEGRILLLNRTGEEITGYRFAAVRGKLMQEILPGVLVAGRDGTATERSSRARRLSFALRTVSSASWVFRFLRCGPASGAPRATSSTSRI